MNNQQRDSLFKALAHESIEHAENIVHEHDEDGENRLIPLPDMFPHGVQDILFVLWQKLGRCLGYDKEGNIQGVKRELPDIINYASFAEAMLNFDEAVELQERKSE